MNAQSALELELAHVDAASLWHPVERVQQLIRSGMPEREDHLARSLQKVEFTGRSVVDLGSNIGHYAFWAALLGAREVRAYDFGPDIVRVGSLLAESNSMPQVSFVLGDFGNLTPPQGVDVAMMLDIIGNNKVRKGRVVPLIDSLTRWSDKELVTNVRPVYEIEQELGVPPEALREYYSDDFIREGRLYLLDFVVAHYGPVWDVISLDVGDPEIDVDKPALLFRKRTS